MMSTSQPPGKMMRVCIITTVHKSRDDRVFHKQALSLALAGYRVTMIARWEPGEDSGPILKRPLPHFRGKVDRLVRGTLCALRLALKEKADAYHFHDPELLFLGVALKLCGKCVIYDVHEDYQQKMLSRHLPPFVRTVAARLWRIYESVSTKWFDHIIAADSHVASLFPARKTTVIANYPPLDFLKRAAIKPVGGNDDVFRIVYVGGISQIRGIGKVIAALDLIQERAVEFHLAGDVAEDDLKQLITRHPKVVYHGVLPWEKVNELLAQADAGVVLFQPVPAFLYYPGENIIKLWEYMGLGLPVLISNFPKLKLLIESLGAGIPVDPTDPVAIAGAIRLLIEQPQVRRQMGERGRHAVVSGRNWDREATKLIAVYEALAPRVSG